MATITPTQKQLILALHKQGLTFQQISDETGIPKTSAYRLLSQEQQNLSTETEHQDSIPKTFQRIPITKGSDLGTVETGVPSVEHFIEAPLLPSSIQESGTSIDIPSPAIDIPVYAELVQLCKQQMETIAVLVYRVQTDDTKREALQTLRANQILGTFDSLCFQLGLQYQLPSWQPESWYSFIAKCETLLKQIESYALQYLHQGGRSLAYTTFTMLFQNIAERVVDDHKALRQIGQVVQMKNISPSIKEELNEAMAIPSIATPSPQWDTDAWNELDGWNEMNC